MKQFTNEELIRMINEKGLKITRVLDVQMKGFETPYKYVMHSEEQLAFDIKLYNLTVLGSEYMLLTDEEIEHIEKEGYIK